jgi:alanyl-tRNA synthetase
LKKQLVEIQNLFNKLMYEVNKNKSLNELQAIKQLPRKINEKKKLVILEYATENNKVINQALTELVNEDKEHAYVLLNKTKVKIQYIVGVSKELAGKKGFDASALIKELNKLSNGSGGGKNTFAQGGTTNFDSYSQILEFLLN